MESTANAASTAPAAQQVPRRALRRRHPRRPRRDAFPKTRLSALASGVAVVVPVACALTYPTHPGSIPPSAKAFASRPPRRPLSRRLRDVVRVAAQPAREPPRTAARPRDRALGLSPAGPRPTDPPLQASNGRQTAGSRFGGLGRVRERLARARPARTRRRGSAPPRARGRRHRTAARWASPIACAPRRGGRRVVHSREPFAMLTCPAAMLHRILGKNGDTGSYPARAGARVGEVRPIRRR